MIMMIIIIIIIIIIIDFSHPTVFVGSFLAVSQIRFVVRRIEIHTSVLSVDSSVRRVLQVFEPYRVVLKDGGGKKHLPLTL